MGYFDLEDLKARISDQGVSKEGVKSIVKLLRKTAEANTF